MGRWANSAKRDGMDTRQLRTLVAIFKHGSFSKAADAVALTPSAVSQQIQSLEDELGVQLFERKTRPPKLTSQGLQVIEFAEDALRKGEELKASLAGDQVSGTLMLGSVRSSALNILPLAIVQLRMRFTELKVSLRVSGSSALIADVASGKLDAAMVAEHIALPPGLKWSPFIKEPLWVITPKTIEAVDVAQLLRTKPFIHFRSPVPLANLIDTEISRLGVVTQDVAEIDTISSIVTCVRQGLGVSVVPQAVLQPHDLEALNLLAFGDPQVTRKMGIVERTVSTRMGIIEELHGLLASSCGQYGIRR